MSVCRRRTGRAEVFVRSVGLGRGAGAGARFTDADSLRLWAAGGLVVYDGCNGWNWALGAISGSYDGVIGVGTVDSSDVAKRRPSTAARWRATWSRSAESWPRKRFRVRVWRKDSRSKT